jgi:putative alpha-1,2-mannosidase
MKIGLRVLGIFLALTAALLLFVGAIESGWAIVVLIIGIGLISTSGSIVGTGSTGRDRNQPGAGAPFGDLASRRR